MVIVAVISEAARRVFMRTLHPRSTRLSIDRSRKLIRERLESPFVDAVAALLDGPRAREAFVLRSSMNPPWSLRIADEAPLTVMALARGHAWALADGGMPPCRLEKGDVAIFRGPEPYTVADDPATPVQAIIHPGQRCT